MLEMEDFNYEFLMWYYFVFVVFILLVDISFCYKRLYYVIIKELFKNRCDKR